MDLKEYIQIFKKFRITFFVVMLATLLMSFTWAFLKPESYSTLLSINVGRTVEETEQQSQDYTYDDFYRLQADERFADTLVRWLSSPRIVLDIYEEAGLLEVKTNKKALAKQFKARRLSSQYIEVSFSTANKDIAEKVTTAMNVVLNEKTANLNSGASEQPWFVVLVDKPVIEKNDVEHIRLFWIGLAVGAFLGFWVVLIRHYLREDNL